MKKKKAPIAKSVFVIFLFFFFIIVSFLVLQYKFIYESFLKRRIALIKIVKHFPFSQENCLREWEEKILMGRVIYVVEKEQSQSYIRAKSEEAASALYYRTRLDIHKSPVISWKWRVDKFPERDASERIEDIKEEDFAARIYVIFPAVFFTNSKVIEYIWSETLPVGTIGVSGYSKNIKVMVLETGKAMEWRFEKRDIYQDYVRLFGEAPRLNVGAIAFMTDADSTKTSADAIYDEINIGYR